MGSVRLDVKMDANIKKQRRDLLLEFRLSQWIEGIISEAKPPNISFEDWIADGTILSKLMRGLVFNSLENDICGPGGSQDLDKWRIRTLISQMKEYGVTEDSLFHEDDLLYRTNIAKVSRCLREVLILAENDANTVAASNQRTFRK